MMKKWKEDKKRNGKKKCDHEESTLKLKLRIFSLEIVFGQKFSFKKLCKSILNRNQEKNKQLERTRIRNNEKKAIIYYSNCKSHPYKNAADFEKAPVTIFHRSDSLEL